MQLNRVPLYVPTSVPYKVLDIGRAVRLLQQHAARSSQPLPAQGMAANAAPSGASGTAPPSAAAAVNDDALPAVAPAQLLAEQDIDDFGQRLSALAAAPTFSGAAMAHAINLIHDKVHDSPGCASNAMRTALTQSSVLHLSHSAYTCSDRHVFAVLGVGA